MFTTLNAMTTSKSKPSFFNKPSALLAKTRLFFGLRPHGGKNILDVEIAFHRDAAQYGSHGKILVTSRKLGLNKIGVHFVFVGLSTPPGLSPSVFEYIWEKAAEKGIQAHEIIYYGTTLKSNVGLPARSMISKSRNDAEDAVKTEDRLSVLNQQGSTAHAVAMTAITQAKKANITT